MLVEMYRIKNLESSRNQDVGEALKNAQQSLKGLPGCLGQRLLIDLDNSGAYIAVSYWADNRSRANANAIHAALDRALQGFRLEKATTVYNVVQEI